MTKPSVSRSGASRSNRRRFLKSTLDYAGALTEANHLDNLAYRLGKKLEWDAVHLRATNCPEADRLIDRRYRKVGRNEPSPGRESSAGRVGN